MEGDVGASVPGFFPELGMEYVLQVVYSITGSGRDFSQCMNITDVCMYACMHTYIHGWMYVCVQYISE